MGAKANSSNEADKRSKGTLQGKLDQAARGPKADCSYQQYVVGQSPDSCFCKKICYL